jgi:FkbH-like protein
MIDLESCPLEDILMSRNSLRRQFESRGGLKDIRIAVLGGSTSNQIVNMLELLLFFNGFCPSFHQGEYGRFYEDAVYNSQDLIAFRPDIVYIFTSCRNVRGIPPHSCTEDERPGYVEAELARFREVWDSLDRNLGCLVLQNNFEMSVNGILGNMDAVSPGGEGRFLAELNIALAREVSNRSKLRIVDVHDLSGRIGLRNWFDWERYFSYKVLLTAEANLELARSLASIVRAIYGKSRKVLILDLDNTLWGGVIGDDGIDKILIGRETPQAEAYTAFQEYCLSLRNRGVLLAVCSKNDEDIAKSGFAHPDSVLKLEHISCFKANWDPKHDNIAKIATELNLGADSFVFVDDNPAERAIVQAQMPDVAVPDVGSEVSRYASIIQQRRYFEPASLSKEDLDRAALYADNSQRAAQVSKFANYSEYLDSLQMTAEIDSFKPLYLDRIAQLTNKTNQFNLTTRRYTLAEMEAVAQDASCIALYGRLSDRFGDNGLISIVVGRREGDALHMDLWLMSCRVLKRDMEIAMLDAVVERAQSMDIHTLYGYYLPTAKNSMVADHYAKLGFKSSLFANPSFVEGATVWELDIKKYTKLNAHIHVQEFTNA